MPIGVLPVDSIYTPVRRVNYQVENTRVGHREDFDKLTMEIWTDGSIEPLEAMSLSAKIMTEHLDIFVNLTDEAKMLKSWSKKKKHKRKNVGNDDRRVRLVCSLLQLFETCRNQYCTRTYK